MKWLKKIKQPEYVIFSIYTIVLFIIFAFLAMTAINSGKNSDNSRKILIIYNNDGSVLRYEGVLGMRDGGNVYTFFLDDKGIITIDKDTRFTIK